MSTENRAAQIAPDQRAVEIRDLPASRAIAAAEVKGGYINGRSSTPRNRGVLPPDWWYGGSNG
jgi:hypothetical protein